MVHPLPWKKQFLMASLYPEGKSQVCVQCSFVQIQARKSNETNNHLHIMNKCTRAWEKYLNKCLDFLSRDEAIRLATSSCGIVTFFLPPEPMCAVGFGVAGLFSTADKQSKQWNFAEYSLTGVWLLIYQNKSKITSTSSCTLDQNCFSLVWEQ